jgi:hypothetical protein
MEPRNPDSDRTGLVMGGMNRNPYEEDAPLRFSSHDKER